MWFASIWIHTLKLPWELGANFFLKNLVDGDPASNTLSWRWVAGLHTKGKCYVASEDNIKNFQMADIYKIIYLIRKYLYQSFKVLYLKRNSLILKNFQKKII